MRIRQRKAPGGAGAELYLRDGRRLGLAEYGDPLGVPCFYFHFVPGSRLDPAVLFARSPAALAGVRLIAVDRPGFGLSDRQPRRGFADFPADVLARAAGLIAVAVLPAAAGITGYAYQHPSAFDRGFTTAVLLAAAICALGGCLAAVTIRNPARKPASPGRPCFNCAVDASALVSSTEGR